MTTSEGFLLQTHQRLELTEPKGQPRGAAIAALYRIPTFYTCLYSCFGMHLPPKFMSILHSIFLQATLSIPILSVPICAPRTNCHMVPLCGSDSMLFHQAQCQRQT
jgi:hypothetical protein